MAHSGKQREEQVIEGELISVKPAREPRLRLGSIREVRRELIKVYAMAKTGKIATQDASRLTFMLQALSGMIRDSELEDRVAALEKNQNESKKKNY